MCAVDMCISGYLDIDTYIGHIGDAEIAQFKVEYKRVSGAYCKRQISSMCERVII